MNMPESREVCDARPGLLERLRGVILVLATPFTARGELDLARFRRLSSHVLGTGVTDVMFPDFGSEFYKLSSEERHTLLDAQLEETAPHPSVWVIVSVAEQAPASPWLRPTLRCGGAPRPATSCRRSCPLPRPTPFAPTPAPSSRRSHRCPSSCRSSRASPVHRSASRIFGHSPPSTAISASSRSRRAQQAARWRSLPRVGRRSRPSSATGGPAPRCPAARSNWCTARLTAHRALPARVEPMIDRQPGGSPRPAPAAAPVPFLLDATGRGAGHGRQAHRPSAGAHRVGLLPDARLTAGRPED